MKRKLFMGVLVFILVVLTACGDDDNEELKMLDVKFEVSEEVDIGETIVLEATVTYGDESVTDADEMMFEYWKRNDRDNSIFVDSENNEDGTYTAEVIFDDDGVYEMYAHTTAEAQHTMPKKYIAVGNTTKEELEKAKNDDKNKRGENNTPQYDKEDRNDSK